MKISRFKLISIIIFVISIILIIATYFYTKNLSEYLKNIYKARESSIIYDRNGEILKILPNSEGYYAIYTSHIPSNFEKWLLQKEDQFFYYHLGINPVRTVVASWNYIVNNQITPSSTITQQLSKILLQHENNRSWQNKLTELGASFALELHTSKAEILEMYINSVYFGEKIQGLNLANKYYFDIPSEFMTKLHVLKLLATIPQPTSNNPFTPNNISKTEFLYHLFFNEDLKIKNTTISQIEQKRQKFFEYIQPDTGFEINHFNLSCSKNCLTTLDNQLQSKIRKIIVQNIQYLSTKNGTHAAVIVIKIPENEIISIIGSPYPKRHKNGYQINMALESRPIGSTIKPFIYLKGFENNLRPYSLVDDREYKYSVNNEFAFYPKNYDYKYRGIVNLQYALTNSLNVPTVKILEYIGINNFNNFLINDLEFKPVQDINNYQLGIALGQLEMDLLTLGYYFTILANHGQLHPLSLQPHTPIYKPQGFTNYNQQKKITETPYIELLTSVLSDRATGVEQFGLKSNLNVFEKNIALKTGTSRDFHDSWVMSYSPDFVVGVWVGNTDNTPMQEVSGQQGAGLIWHEVMELLLNSKYFTKSEFTYNHLQSYAFKDNLIYGLPKDDIKISRSLLMEPQIIVSPHNTDTFLLEKNLIIPLHATQNVDWFINNKYLKTGEKTSFHPQNAGNFLIEAKQKGEILDQRLITIEKPSE